MAESGPDASEVGNDADADRKACGKQVSWELADACLLPDVPGTDPASPVGERKVGSWLFHNRAAIIDAEHKWCVDRRAIAGAIAFEALKDVQSSLRHRLSQRSFGPGKVHLVNWYSQFYEFYTTIQQTEQAGYLKWVGITASNLRQQLGTTKGSITCIAAIMRADADAASTIGGYSVEDTYWNPSILAAWFQGKTLRELIERFSKQGQQGQRVPLEPGSIPMGTWVRDRESYLEIYVGTPDQCINIKPIPGATDLRQWAQAYDTKVRRQLVSLGKKHPGEW